MSNGTDAFSFLEAVEEYRPSEGSRVKFATVYSTHADGVRVTFDGESTPTLKRYRYTAPAAPEVGARVALLRVGQSFIILGTLRASGGSGGGLEEPLTLTQKLTGTEAEFSSLVHATSATWKNHLRATRGTYGYADFTVGAGSEGQLHFNGALALIFTSSSVKVAGSSLTVAGNEVLAPPSAWSTPTFYSAFGNFNSDNTSWPTLQYKVIGDLCYVKGMVQRDSGSTSTLIAYGFPRPMHDSIHIVANQEQPFYVQMEKRYSDGRLVLRPGTANDSRMSLGMLVYQLA